MPTERTDDSGRIEDVRAREVFDDFFERHPELKEEFAKSKVSILGFVLAMLIMVPLLFVMTLWAKIVGDMPWRKK